MPKLSRKGDKNSVGGMILRGSESTVVDNIPVGLHMSKISPHAPWDPVTHPPHDHASTTTGSQYILVDNVPVLFVGSQTTCGHPITTGSETVLIA